MMKDKKVTADVISLLNSFFQLTISLEVKVA